MKRKRDHPKQKAGDPNHGGGSAASVTPAKTQRAVRFEFVAPDARDVLIAGSFDNWNTTGLPMVRLENGTWVKELTLEPGTYEYLFIVDGVWTPDPSAPASVPNPYGGINSCVTVT